MIDDFSHGDTRISHTTHKHQILRIEYRWHPLYQRKILVTRKFERFGLRIVRGRPVDTDQSQDGFDLPCWMFDRAYCSSVKLTQNPHVNVEQLATLSQVLEIYLSQAKIGDDNPIADEEKNITHKPSGRSRKRTTDQTARTIRIDGHTEPMASGSDGAAIRSSRTRSTDATGARTRNSKTEGNL